MLDGSQNTLPSAGRSGGHTLQSQGAGTGGRRAMALARFDGHPLLTFPARIRNGRIARLCRGWDRPLMTFTINLAKTIPTNSRESSCKSHRWIHAETLPSEPTRAIDFRRQHRGCPVLQPRLLTSHRPLSVHTATCTSRRPERPRRTASIGWARYGSRTRGRWHHPPFRWKGSSCGTRRPQWQISLIRMRSETATTARRLSSRSTSPAPITFTFLITRFASVSSGAPP